MIGNRRTMEALRCKLIMMIAIGVAMCGCVDEPATIKQAVFFDIDSKQAVVSPAVDKYPAIHHLTGKATLMPAMYCQKCAVWRQTPMPEQINRMKQSITCVKCKNALVIQGPYPK